MSSSRPIKIVGAGFCGLTAAYFLTKRGLPVEIFESQAEVGGLIRTQRLTEGLVETGANGVLNSALFEELAAELGVEILPARRESRKRYIWRAGRAHRWPLRLGETIGAIWRFLRAGFAEGGRKPRAGETVKEWGDRVFGAAFTNQLIAPALQGIYAGDEKRLSASLILGRFFGKKSSAPAPKPRFRGTVSPRDGMGSFLRALRGWLEKRGVRIHLNAPITAEALAADDSGPWVLATGAQAASRLLSRRAPELYRRLAGIEMIPIATATLFFPWAESWLEGFGCLFPRREPFRVLGILFNGFIFEHRGPAYSETWIFRDEALSDVDLLACIQDERARLSGSRTKPQNFRVTRWPEALPHYTLDLETALPLIESDAKKAKVLLLGNYLGRLSLARMLDGVRTSCEQLAEVQK